MPKPSAAAVEAFRELVPTGPTVNLRPMFGNLAAFVNGNMFAGLFGERLFVRAPDDRRAELIRHGATDFEPMPGRAMKGYVTLPDTWRTAPEPAARHLAQALEFTAALPVKVLKPKKKG